MSLTLIRDFLESRFGSKRLDRVYQRTNRYRVSRRPSFTPHLLVLEDRTTPSTFTVLNTADSGPDSLRQAILDSNASPGADTIAFDIGGGGLQSIQPTSALPEITDPVMIDGTTQPGYVGSPLVVLNGNGFNGGQNGYGLLITAGDSTVRGLVINGFTGSEIRISGGGNNNIVGNYLGTDVTGTLAVRGSPSTANNGLFILSPDNTVGGTTAGDRNLISGQNGTGILISGTFTTGNRVQGNYIGTDVTGTLALGNGWGVDVRAPNTLIGGTTAEARNIISGNGYGLSLWDREAVVQGNYIGTDVTGTRSVGNGIGVEFNSGIGTLIGGTTAEERNIISGNDGVGINSYAGGIFLNSRIQGNFIGTDITGNLGLGNTIGVSINGPNMSLGGTATGAGNLISDNSSFGIIIQAAGTLVQGNYIGTDAAGIGDLGNGGDGIALFGSSDNVIGDTGAGQGNTIAFNGGNGVVVHSGLGNSIRSNSIHSNAALGIDLGGDGATPNDPGDADAGANNFQNSPVVTSALTGSTTLVAGILRSSANTTFNLDFYASPPANPSGFVEGARYLGSALVTTDAGGNARFAVTLPATTADEVVTATATDAAGNTSEFSRAPVADLQVTMLPRTQRSAIGHLVTFLIVVTNVGPNPAVNTILTDHLPVGLRFVSATTTQGIYQASNGHWTIGTLASGSSATLRLTVRVTAAGTIRNTARVSSDVFDPNESNNTATAAINSGSINISKRLLLLSTFR